MDISDALGSLGSGYLRPSRIDYGRYREHGEEKRIADSLEVSHTSLHIGDTILKTCHGVFTAKGENPMFRLVKSLPK